MKLSAGTGSNQSTINHVIALLLIVLCVAVAYLTVSAGAIIPLLFIGLVLVCTFSFFLAKNPIIGLLFVLSYCFFLPATRELFIEVQWGLAVEGILILTWLAALFAKPDLVKWENCKNDLTVLVSIWLVISILQVVQGASILGWIHEIRTTALILVLVIPLTSALFTEKRYLDVFLRMLIFWSVFGTLYGLKQLYIGMFPGEAAFLEANKGTHLIYKQLRVFSFYTDAGQFGASQAHISLICFILAMGPFKRNTRILLALAGCLLFYGMMISGTRGAFFVFAGLLPGLFLTKNFKVLCMGMAFGILLFAFLKFSDIGQGNYHIRRLRTAVNPSEDASYMVRVNSQMKLRAYLANKPLGGGLGTIGRNGKDYNPWNYLSTIEPDSYWVKVWAMYGIVGLVIWFCMMMYIMGKCCGIIWNIRDPSLRIKLVALVSGTIGVFVSSYGNEVMNRTPSSIIVCMSWAIIYLAAKWDTPEDSASKQTLT